MLPSTNQYGYLLTKCQSLYSSLFSCYTFMGFDKFSWPCCNPSVRAAQLAQVAGQPSRWQGSALGWNQHQPWSPWAGHYKPLALNVCLDAACPFHSVMVWTLTSRVALPGCTQPAGLCANDLFSLAEPWVRSAEVGKVTCFQTCQGASTFAPRYLQQCIPGGVGWWSRPPSSEVHMCSRASNLARSLRVTSVQVWGSALAPGWVGLLFKGPKQICKL